MKFVKKNKAKSFNNGKTCTAIEYPMNEKDINGAVIKLDGRYPEKGRVINKICKEMAYVIRGFGKVVVDGKETRLKEGDLILIYPGEKFFWKGNMTLFMPCVPAWNPGQYKQVK